MDLKKRSEYFPVTTSSGESHTTSGERNNEQVTPAIPTPVADTDEHLSEVASSMPRVDPEELTVKHNAFLAQLLMEEVDLGESRPSGSYDHAVSSKRATDGPTG